MISAAKPGWQTTVIPLFGKIIHILLAVASVFIAFTQLSLAADEPGARIYRSPEERREAGIGHEITDWLTFSGLLEAEYEYRKNTALGGNKLHGQRESSQSLQLGLDAELADNITAEFTYEYEIDRDHGSVEEAFVEYEADSWGVKLGREDISFGEYYSHFATGPLLEFGETRADALSLGYKFLPGFEIFGFVFEGDATYADRDRSRLDYGGGFEITARDEAFIVGLTFLSDLAESDENFLQDAGDRYQTRVAGLNSYLLLALPQFELSAELVMALDEFRELEPEIDKPAAYNLELAWLPYSSWQLAFRLEGSEELEDEPERQYGISSSWLLGKYLYFSLDYLYGEYRPGFATDDDDNELESRHSAAVQISIEF